MTHQTNKRAVWPIISIVFTGIGPSKWMEPARVRFSYKHATKTVKPLNSLQMSLYTCNETRKVPEKRKSTGFV